MCETRHEFKMARSAYKSTSDPVADEPATPKSESKVSELKTKVPRQKKAPTTDGDKKDWTFVGRKK
jgi:hypothetical protein